jgi:hypothetical protein
MIKMISGYKIKAMPGNCRYRQLAVEKISEKTIFPLNAGIIEGNIGNSTSVRG